MRAALLAASLLAAVSAQGDLITDLPGWSGKSFAQYAGYVNVDAAAGRNLFYWLVEAQSNVSSAPLVLWLNGGPGCSSVGGGLFSENGPWYPQPNGTLSPNPYSWNTIANVVYLESPAGVGFSYSNTPSDYTTVGDARTANDSYVFLQGFLKMYPQFQNSPFWISGESYGGHYVPGLAARIVEGNAAAAKTGDLVINLQGFMVGNAWTDAGMDNLGALNYWLSHGIIAIDTYNGVVNNCNMSNIGPLAARMTNKFKTGSGVQDMAQDDENDACNTFQNLAFAQMGNINIYDIYADVCVASSPEKSLQQKSRRLVGADYPSGGVMGYEPCIDDYTTAYLNTPAVQKAIHANMSLPWKWGTCSSVVEYSRYDLLTSMLPTYRFLLQSGIQMLVYSGDVDAIVPVTGTMAWLYNLSLPILEPKRPWSFLDQVGGRVTVYNGLTFSTVRNAGHMVPYGQPDRALYLVNQFINGQPL